MSRRRIGGSNDADALHPYIPFQLTPYVTSDCDKSASLSSNRAVFFSKSAINHRRDVSHAFRVRQRRQHLFAGGTFVPGGVRDRSHKIGFHRHWNLHLGGRSSGLRETYHVVVDGANDRGEDLRGGQAHWLRVLRPDGRLANHGRQSQGRVPESLVRVQRKNDCGIGRSGRLQLGYPVWRQRRRRQRHVQAVRRGDSLCGDRRERTPTLPHGPVRHLRPVRRQSHRLRQRRSSTIAAGSLSQVDDSEGSDKGGAHHTQTGDGGEAQRHEHRSDDDDARRALSHVHQGGVAGGD